MDQAKEGARDMLDSKQLRLIAGKSKYMVIWVLGLDLSAFLLDINKTKWCNGFYIEFRQSFAKETFSYDEYSKS